MRSRERKENQPLEKFRHIKICINTSSSSYPRSSRRDGLCQKNSSRPDWFLNGSNVRASFFLKPFLFVFLHQKAGRMLSLKLSRTDTLYCCLLNTYHRLLKTDSSSTRRNITISPPTAVAKRDGKKGKQKPRRCTSKRARN